MRTRRPHPRIRKAVKWGGAVVSVLLVVVWVASAWWVVSWGNATLHYFHLEYGQVTLWLDPATKATNDARFNFSLQQLPSLRQEEAAARALAKSDDDLRVFNAENNRMWHELIVEKLRNGWRVQRIPPELHLWSKVDFRTGRWRITVPIGITALPAIAYLAAVYWRGFRRRRRCRAGHCPICNYNRTGIAAGAVCPECGAGAVVEGAATPNS